MNLFFIANESQTNFIQGDVFHDYHSFFGTISDKTIVLMPPDGRWLSERTQTTICLNCSSRFKHSSVNAFPIPIFWRDLTHRSRRLHQCLAMDLGIRQYKQIQAHSYRTSDNRILRMRFRHATELSRLRLGLQNLTSVRFAISLR
jgi:hypothetical protein